MNAAAITFGKGKVNQSYPTTQCTCMGQRRIHKLACGILNARSLNKTLLLFFLLNLPSSARRQHARQRTLLRTRNRQTIHALNLDPHPRVDAVVAG